MNQAVETVEPEIDDRTALAQRIDAALFRNDLSKLTDEERVVHVHRVCKSIGLNPKTQPLQYITLNGKLTLYAKRDACDQLRKIHGVNLEIVSRTVTGDLLTVHVRARDKTGRIDEDFGVVSIAGLRGEAAANAMLKAVTKAKRRATLSICGLGFSDESEVEDIPHAFAQLDKPAGNPAMQNVELEQKEEPETDPFELTRADDTEATWSAWATTLLAHVKRAKTHGRVDEWIIANSESLEALKQYDQGKFNRLRHMIQAAQDAKARDAKS